jgi:hypothetical protein
LYCDLSLNYLPKGQLCLEKDISDTREVVVIYEKQKDEKDVNNRQLRWKKLPHGYHHIQNWVNQSSLFHSARQDRYCPAQSLLTKDIECTLSTDLAVVSLFANKVDGFFAQLLKEHAYLGIEYLTKHGQRRIIFGELFVDKNNQIKITITQVTGQEFLYRTKELDRVYQQELRLSKQQRKKLLNFLFAQRQVQKLLRYKKTGPFSENEYNCMELVTKALEAALNDKEKGYVFKFDSKSWKIPSAFVSRNSICCIF